MNLRMGVSSKQSMPSFLQDEHFLPRDTHTCLYVSEGKKCSFCGKVGVLCFFFEISPFALLLTNCCLMITSKICAARRDWNFMFCPGWRVIWILTKKILLKTYITSLFNYFPLVWMCYNRSLNNNIDISHELALRIVYQDKKSDFETLLEMKNNISLDVMRDIFHFWKWKLQLKEWHSRSCKYEMEL